MQEKQHTREIAEHFSSLTGYWKDIYAHPVGPGDFYHHEAVLKRKAAVLDFVDAFARGRRMRILDSGCGTGILMKALLERGHSVVGVDVSAEMLAEARKTTAGVPGGDVEIRPGSVESLDFPEASFDVCLCIGVLQYLDEERSALRELARVTKPGGHLICSLPNILRLTTLLDPYYYVDRGPRFIQYKILGMNPKKTVRMSEDLEKNLSFKNKRYTFGYLRRMCARLGLSIKGVRPIGYGPMTVWRREVLPGSFVIRLSRQIERMAMLKPLSFLKAVADRWVYDLEKRADQ